MTTKPVLVLGATGKTGRRVMERLTARELPLRAGSRSGNPPFDWNDRTTWSAALKGVGAVYVTYYPDVAIPGAANTVGDFARLAVDNGVRRLVLLSGRGEDRAVLAERAVQESGADWTVLRSSWFSQNFSEGLFVDHVLAGELALPVTTVGEPFVDADDLADVAVAALTDDRHVGQLYELTGPRLLTFAEAVEEIARASGRQIRFVSVSREAYALSLSEQNVPAEFVSLVKYLFAEVLDGRNAHLADGVQRALGRPPRDFADYARKTAATGIWGCAHHPLAHAGSGVSQ